MKIPAAAWGFLGAVVGGAMAVLGGYLVARSERRAKLAQSNRIQIYEPALRALRQMLRVLERRPFSAIVVLEASSSGVARLKGGRHAVALDLSWWQRQKDEGAHLRVAPSIANRLDGVIEAARTYKESRQLFQRRVNVLLTEKARAREGELREGFGEESGLFMKERESLMIDLLRGDLESAMNRLTGFFGDEEEARTIVSTLTSDPMCEDVVQDARKLALLAGKTAAVLEEHMSRILKRFEKRNEDV